MLAEQHPSAAVSKTNFRIILIFLLRHTVTRWSVPLAKKLNPQNVELRRATVCPQPNPLPRPSSPSSSPSIQPSKRKQSGRNERASLRPRSTIHQEALLFASQSANYNSLILDTISLKGSRLRVAKAKVRRPQPRSLINNSPQHFNTP